MKTRNVRWLYPAVAIIMAGVAVIGGNFMRADVTTPCGANVATTALQGDDWSAAQKAALDAQIAADFPAVTVHALSATKTYNCHSYAWHNINGSGLWMNDPGNYIDSYAMDFDNGHQLTYMHCLTNDPSHSAKDHVPFDYKATSKWGNLPLVDHEWDDVLHGTVNGHAYAEYGEVTGIYSSRECCGEPDDCTN